MPQFTSRCALGGINLSLDDTGPNETGRGMSAHKVKQSGVVCVCMRAASDKCSYYGVAGEQYKSHAYKGGAKSQGHKPEPEALSAQRRWWWW